MQAHHKILEEALRDKQDIMQDFVNFKEQSRDRETRLELQNYELTK